MSSVEDLIKSLFGKLQSSFDEKLTKLSTDLESKFDPLQKQIKSLSDNFDAFKGETNERLLRESVQKLYGENFSRRFCVQGISGLVRLLIPPRKNHMRYHPRDLSKAFQYSDGQGNSNELSDNQLQEAGVKAIVSFIHREDAAYKCLKLLLEQIQCTTSMDCDIDDIVAQALNIKLFSAMSVTVDQAQVNTEKVRVQNLCNILDIYVTAISAGGYDNNEYCRLFAYFVKFVKMAKGEQAKELLSDSGLGLMFFCACFPNIEDYFPIIDLEYDCRGEIDQYTTSVGTTTGANHDVTFTIVAGEIKSSMSGVPKAKRQLGKRLGIMKEALKLMPHYKPVLGQPEPMIVTRGVIFLPTNESKDVGKGNALLPTSNDYSLEFVFC